MSEGVANDNIRPGIQSSIEYLMSGGLGEVIGLHRLSSARRPTEGPVRLRSGYGAVPIGVRSDRCSQGLH